MVQFLVRSHTPTWVIMMAYIQRNDAGKIIAVFDEKQSGAPEYLAIDSSELIEYLTRSDSNNDAKTMLASSDINLVRVLEDLIYTLIDKKVIMFTDLPLAAREKLVNRGRIRGNLTDLDDLVDDNEGLL